MRGPRFRVDLRPPRPQIDARCEGRIKPGRIGGASRIPPEFALEPGTKAHRGSVCLTPMNHANPVASSASSPFPAARESSALAIPIRSASPSHPVNSTRLWSAAPSGRNPHSPPSTAGRVERFRATRSSPGIRLEQRIVVKRPDSGSECPAPVPPARKSGVPGRESADRRRRCTPECRRVRTAPDEHVLGNGRDRR